MELQGKIIAALDVKSGTSKRGSDYKVQEFVLETIDGQYSRKMVFTVFGEDRLQRFNIQVGQDVTVSFDIDAHEYNGRWFNSIRAFDVRPIVAAATVPPTPQPPFAQPVPQTPAGDPSYVPPTAQPAPGGFADDFAAQPGGEQGDDLPF